MGSIEIGNAGGVQEATSGCIRAGRTPGGNITIDTTHTVGGLIRTIGSRPWIEIERADLDDAIAALQALRGDPARYAPDAVPPGALADASLRLEIASKMEAAHERLIAHLNERQPAPAGLAMRGRWRIYFNKHGRSDLPWCVAPEDGGWEIAVASVGIGVGVAAATVYQPKVTPDDEDGRPSAWIAVEGVLRVPPSGHAGIGAL